MRNLCNSSSVSALFKAHFSVSNFSVKIWCSLLAGAFAFSSQGELTLAEHGTSRYQIVISTNALASERYAAEELQRYLEKISGAKLPIIPDSKRPAAGEILI